MQIERINNSTSFKGLWSFAQEEPVSGGYTPVYKQKAFYHPFKNENEAQVKREIEKANKHNIKLFYDTRGCDYAQAKHVLPEKCVVIKPEIGTTINISSDEYKALKKMSKDACPKTDAYYLEYKDASYEELHTDVKKAIDAII